MEGMQTMKHQRSSSKKNHLTTRYAWLFLLALVLALTAALAAARPAPAGGLDFSFFQPKALRDAPTPENGVYQIGTAEELAWFRDLVNGTLEGTPKNTAANAKLTADIDMSAVCGETAGPGDSELSWVPIGSNGNYTGDFNGNGKSLTNLYINATSGNAGLFGNNAGMIRNLTIASGTLQSSGNYFAALAGNNRDGSVYHCANLADVQSSGNFAAGLTCDNVRGTIVRSFNKGDVSAVKQAAGVALSLSGGSMESCYNTGNISVSGSSARYPVERAGGVMGYGSGNTITSCYNAGNVGEVEDEAGLRGGVIASQEQAHLSGVSNTYFLQTETVNAGVNAVGGPGTATAEQAAPVNEEQLQGLAGQLGADFAADDDPNINDGYPVLSWQLSHELFRGISVKPVISTSWTKATQYWGAGFTGTLTVTVQPVSDGGELTYQWYSSTTNEPDDFEPVDEGGDEASYSPDTSTAGITTYYYVAVTNTAGDRIPTTVESRVATVTVVPPLTVKIDGTELTGLTLQSIVEDQYEGGHDAALNAGRFEIVGGALTEPDLTYLFQDLTGDGNTNDGVTVKIAAPPAVDFSYIEFLNSQYNPKMFRMECPGLKQLGSWSTLGTDGDRLPTLYVPDVETISASPIGSFWNSRVTTLYLPRIKTIGTGAFTATRNTAMQTVILPGDMPTIQWQAFALPANREGKQITLWVPADKVEAYRDAVEMDDPDSAGNTAYCLVKAIPAAVSGESDEAWLRSFATWAIGRVPALSGITPAHAEAIYLARDLMSTLPESVAVTMEAEVDKAYAAYERLRPILVDDLENRIAALPDVGEVTVDDEAQINGVWNDYNNLNPEFRPDVPAASVTRLNQVYSNLQEVLFDHHMAIGTPFVSIDTLTDGTKRLNTGETFAEFKYSGWADTSHMTTYVGRGAFEAEEFFGSLGYTYHDVVTTSDQVSIGGGELPTCTKNSNLRYPKRLCLPTVTRMQSHAIMTRNYAPDWRLELPNIVSMGEDAYFDSHASKRNKAALYLPLMARLEECKTILRAADSSLLMLPRLNTGERVFYATPQQYVLLPALSEVGAGFFANSATLEAAWLPQATKINGGAFTDAGIGTLFLGEEPPAVLGSGGLASAAAERTVYVPDGAVDAYKAVDDGDSSDGAWYGWTVQPMSAAENLDDLLNAHIAALPAADELTLDYTEWLGQLDDAREALTEAQRAGLDNETLDAALAAVAVLGSAEEIAAVEEMISALGDPAEITLEQRAAVAEARAAYDALVRIAQSQVSNRDDLFAAEANLRPLIIADVKARIAAIPDPLLADDVDEIRSLYREYLDLSDEEREQFDEDEVAKLNAAVDEVAAIERDQQRAAALERRIEALPALARLKLRHEGAVMSVSAAYERLGARAKGYVDPEALEKLDAAVAKIAELKGGAAGQKTVYVAVEKFTLGRGYVTEPVPVTITPETGSTVAAIICDLIGAERCRYGGTPTSSFYLQAVKDDDQEAVAVPQYILDQIEADGKTLGDRNQQNWLGEFDYTDMAGWIYAVNNVSPNKGASEYTYAMLRNGDVIRWQFSLYGYGRDLGYGMFGAPYWKVADKDVLTAEIAKVNASPQKEEWLEDATWEAAYNEAYAVAGNMTATQGQVDAAVAALRRKPAGELGTVTVTVSDAAPRRQAITTVVGAPIQFENLTGLGAYQQPFGAIIENVAVPVAEGMNARQAVVAALESEGYEATVRSGRITAVGPLLTPDRSETVAALAKGDAGERSRWVLSRNADAIAASESAADFTVRARDQLRLDYSVDGGYDVGCFPYASSTFEVELAPDGRLAGEGNERDLYLPENTDELTVAWERAGSAEAPDLCNRAHKLLLTAGGKEYRAGDPIAVAPGDAVKLTVRNPLSAGGSIQDSISGKVTGSGVDRTLTLAVKHLMTPQHLDEAIMALPAVEQLDYDTHNATIVELQTQYNLFTEDEKGQVSEEAVAKLEAAVARMAEIFNADNAKVEQIVALVKGYHGKITADNYAEHRDAVNQSLTLYGELNRRVSAEFEETVYYLRMIAARDLIERYSGGITGTIGIPTDYPNDYLLTANAFNLDLGAPDDAYRVVFLDTPRIGYEAYHLPDRLQFEIKDPSIFEIEAVPYLHVDGGMMGSGQRFPSVKYFLIPKKAGTTTFTCSYDGFVGQTPEMVVHVNNPAESSVENLAGELTDISSREHTSKYDTWHYMEGQRGAPFTFKVNGENAQVSVYDYLGYDEAGAATRTEYPVDADGTVTVLLKDGYNPIEVTATYDGQRVTQVYGLKGKVISYELANVTDPEAGDSFKEGDTASLKIKGLATPVHKMLRIYNPAATQFWFDTNMPRYDIIKSGGGQYDAGEMQFVVTDAGKAVLRSGRVFQDWFGSPLYSESDAPGGGMAPQSQKMFSIIPDIRFMVAENPAYNPELIVPQIEGGATVKAGVKATILLPTLDASPLAEQYQGRNALRKACTVFRTDIPNCDPVSSREARDTGELDRLKTVEFTVPASTPPGRYHIYGGRVDVTYGESTWLKYADHFVAEIDDLTVEVAASDAYVGLHIAKADAVAALEAYADPDDYRQAQRAELAAAIAAGKRAIDVADDEAAVAAALTEAQQAIDAIATADEVSAQEDANAIAAAKATLEGAAWQTTQEQAPDEAGALAAVEALLGELDLGGVEAVVAPVSYQAPQAGTAENPAGTDGAYVFTVRLNKGVAEEQVTGELTLVITATAYVEPEKIPLADATVTLAVRANGTLTWTGKKLRPAVRSVTVGDQVFQQGVDFEVAYGSNTAVGKGTVKLIATADGRLSGERVLPFKIIPRSTAVRSLKAGARRLTVTFNEVTRKLQLRHYRIRYRVVGARAWQSRTITRSYTDNNTLARQTLTHLQKGKRYQVTLLAGKKVGGSWYWSQPAKVKTSARIK